MNTTTMTMQQVHNRVNRKVQMSNPSTTKATLKHFWPSNHKDAPLTKEELSMNETNSTPRLIQNRFDNFSSQLSD